jgi:hypothetical protein
MRSSVNLALFEKSSRPKSVKVIMKRKSRMEKVAISTRVRPRVSIKISKRFHDLANLKILSNLKPLRAVTMLRESLSSSFSYFTKNVARNMSMKPDMTTKQSNTLNIDLK